MPLASVNLNRQQFARVSPLEGRVPTSEFVDLTIKSTLYDLPMWSTQRAGALLGYGIVNEYNPLLSVEEANEKWGLEDDGFGDGGVKFKKPVAANKAFEIYSLKLAERERQARLAKANDSTGRMLGGFAIGLGAQGLDPVNLGLMFLFPGMSQANEARMAVTHGKTVARVAASASGVAVGMATAEPFSYMSKMMGEQNEYGPKDSMINFVAGLALGTGLKLTGGAIEDHLARSAKTLGDLPPGVAKRVIGEAIANMYTDKPVDPLKTTKSDALSRLKQTMEQADRKLQIDEANGEGIKVDISGVDEPVQRAIKFHSKKTVPESILPQGTENLTLSYGKTSVTIASGAKGAIVVDTQAIGTPEELQAIVRQLFKEVDEYNTGVLINKAAGIIGDPVSVYVNGVRYDNAAISKLITGVDVEDVIGGRVIDKPGTVKEHIQYAQEDTVIEGNLVKKGDIVARYKTEAGRTLGKLSELKQKRNQAVDNLVQLPERTRVEVEADRIHQQAEVSKPSASVPDEIDGPQKIAGKRVLSLDELEETMNGYVEAADNKLINDFNEDDLDTDTLFDMLENFNDQTYEAVAKSLEDRGYSQETIDQILKTLDSTDAENDFAVYDTIRDCLLAGGE